MHSHNLLREMRIMEVEELLTCRKSVMGPVERDAARTSGGLLGALQSAVDIYADLEIKFEDGGILFVPRWAVPLLTAAVLRENEAMRTHDRKEEFQTRISRSPTCAAGALRALAEHRARTEQATRVRV